MERIAMYLHNRSILCVQERRILSVFSNTSLTTILAFSVASLIFTIES